MLDNHSQPSRGDDTDVYIKTAILLSDEILHGLQYRTKSDASLGMIALAISLCRLTNIDRLPFEAVLDLVTSIHRDLEVYDGDIKSTH